MEDLGTARQVRVTKDETTIVEGHGDAQAIKERVAQIKSQIADTTSDFDKEKLQERLAKMSGGVAVIEVGAATEVELKDKKYRLEDALNATRAAVEEGIVSGGGTTSSTSSRLSTNSKKKATFRPVSTSSNALLKLRSVRSLKTPASKARSSSLRSKHPMTA